MGEACALKVLVVIFALSEFVLFLRIGIDTVLKQAHCQVQPSSGCQNAFGNVSADADGDSAFVVGNGGRGLKACECGAGKVRFVAVVGKFGEDDAVIGRTVLKSHGNEGQVGGAVHGDGWYDDGRGVVVAHVEHESGSLVVTEHPLVIEVLCHQVQLFAVALVSGQEVLIVVSRHVVDVLALVEFHERCALVFGSHIGRHFGGLVFHLVGDSVVVRPYLGDAEGVDSVAERPYRDGDTFLHA